VRAVPVVGEEGRHDPRHGLKVMLGLEQRGDVQGYISVHAEATPPREQQYREHVVRSLGHADDVRTDGALSVACPALGDRREDGERPLGLVIRRRDGPLSGRQGASHPLCPLRARALEPGGIAEQAAHNTAMHQCVLTDVE
jgi:hypothetical protein